MPINEGVEVLQFDTRHLRTTLIASPLLSETVRIRSVGPELAATARLDAA